MTPDHPAPESRAAVHAHASTLFASLELSRSRWLVTVSAPGSDKLSKHALDGGDGGVLLALLARLRAAAARRLDAAVRVIVIQEAGLDGFWIHRLLVASGIESHIVDPASIAVSRRARRAKTDTIDGEALLRTLMAWARGEPRVCSMVVPPTPDDEDRRRLSRERKVLIGERIRYVNRIKGLLMSQGITGYEPLRRDRRQHLAELKTCDGRRLPPRLQSEILRTLDRLDLVLRQLTEVE